MGDLAMFHVYRSNDLEVLADRLSEVAAGPLPPGGVGGSDAHSPSSRVADSFALDPLAPEIVVVQSRVLERWLSQQLARRQGIWANPRFPFPRASVDDLLARVLGDEAERDDGVFVGDRLRFAVARHLPEAMAAEPAAFAAVTRYLAGDEDPGDAPVPPASGDEERANEERANAERADAERADEERADEERPPGASGDSAPGTAGEALASARLMQLSGQVAELFDRYALYRPEQVCAWDRAPEPEWQSLLWHRLVRAHGATHVAARALRFGEALAREGAAARALPPRLHLFAVRTLPPLFLQIFATVSRFREVYLYQLSPCREYWADLRREDLDDPPPTITGDGGGPAAPEPNPLLVSLGRLGSDFQTLLEEWVGETVEEGERWVDPLRSGLGAEEGSGAGEEASVTALRILQSDVLTLRHRRPAGPVSPLVVPEADRSVSVHACSGAMREAEVLRDQLLDAFDALEDLQPHEVAVLCPDLATYAPFLQAVLDVDPDEPGFLPYALSDRAPRQALLGLETVGALLELLGSRLPLSAVEALLAREPVRERFSLSAEDAEAFGGWLRDAGARWGEDAAHREAVGQPAYRAYSLRLALDRLLLGYAVESDGWSRFAGVLPETPPGRDRALLAQGAAFLEALFEARQLVASPATLAAWQGRVGSLVSALLSDRAPFDWQAQLVRDAAADLAAAAAGAGFGAPVAFDVYRGLLLDRIDVAPPPRGFLSGGVTVAELRPLRSVPFRVVALVGMNDGTFPRVDRRPAFDRVASEPRRGDRSVRDDDRYQLLETLLATRDRLIVTYTGIDAGQGLSRPPSVLVAELLDALGESVSRSPGEGETPGGDLVAAARQRWVTRHPLHPFDPRYFTARSVEDSSGNDSGLGDALFSYARRHLAGAKALVGPREPPPPFFSQATLPSAATGGGAAGARESAVGAGQVVDLDDLPETLLDPIAVLVRDRLGVRLVQDQTPPEDREPTSLNGLAVYEVRKILMERLDKGEDVSDGAEALLARGLLPWGSTGRAALAAKGPLAAALVKQAEEAQGGERRDPMPVRIPLPGGELVGWLRDLYPAAQVIASPGELHAKRLMRAWVWHLALSGLGEPDLPGETILVGRGRESVATRIFGPLGREDARDRLADLTALYRLAHQVPLRLFPGASLAYAEHLARHPEDWAGALWAATKVWRGGGHRAGDGAAPACALVFGGTDPISAPAGPGPDGRLDPQLSFAALAQRVWGSLLEGIQGGKT